MSCHAFSLDFVFIILYLVSTYEICIAILSENQIAGHGQYGNCYRAFLRLRLCQHMNGVITSVDSCHSFAMLFFKYLRACYSCTTQNFKYPISYT